MSKKRNRQPDANCEQSDSSSESGEESNTGGECPHIGKAVNFKKVIRRISKDGIATSCPQCTKDGNEVKNDSETPVNNNIVICLQCGMQLCGKNQKNHAKDHYDTPHSDCHSLFVDVNTWCTQCYVCGNCKLTKKLKEVVDYTKKYTKQPKTVATPTAQTQKKVEDEKEKAEVQKFPRVCGLTNLGNTCFFNSVLQCLARTPFLLSTLESLKPAGQNFTLPGGLLNTAGEEVDLPSISGTLDHWGRFTALLHTTLTDLQDSPKTITPDALLQAFNKKVTYCADGGQHDAHELLRHLLEVLRAEDLRRYQRIILNQLGLNDKTNPDKVEDSLKSRVKFYGNQASARLLGAEVVFGGVLVSTLECQDCGNCSRSKEMFLDLSVPVAGDQVHPPVLKRKNGGVEDTSHNQPPARHSKFAPRKGRTSYRERCRYKQDMSCFDQINMDIGPDIFTKCLQLKSVMDTPKTELHSNTELETDKKEESDADVEDNVDLESTFVKTFDKQSHSRLVPNECQNGDNANKYPMVSKSEENSLESSVILQNGEVNVENVNPCLQLNPEEESSVQTPSQSEPSPCSFPPVESRELTLASLSSPSATNTSVSNESLASPDCAVVNRQERLEKLDRPVSRLEMVEAKEKWDKEEGWSQRKSRRKSEEAPTVGNGKSEENGVNGITSEVSTVLLENHESPTRKADDMNEDQNINGITMGVSNISLESYESPRRYQISEGECSIQSCLNQFTALELLTGSNKVGCEVCTAREKKLKNTTKLVYTPAAKQYLIQQVPPVLILHVKRFQAQRIDFRKVTRHVQFPAVLNLAPVCLGKPKDRVYALYGVVEHSGTIHGGHYVAYVKSRTPMQPDDPRWSFLPRGNQSHSYTGRVDSDPEAGKKCEEKEEKQEKQEMEENEKRVEAPEGQEKRMEAPAGKWYHVSDSRVTEVDESTVLQRQAYLLFYERIL